MTRAPLDDFESFYRAEADRLYRALAVTLGDPQLARDAADEAMARAYAHWGRVRDHDNPGGWAFRVGLNWATSWWRKVRRERPLPFTETGARVDGPDTHAGAALDAGRKLFRPTPGRRRGPARRRGPRLPGRADHSRWRWRRRRRATVSLLKSGSDELRHLFPVRSSLIDKGLRPGTLGVGWVGGTVRVVWVRMPSPGVHPLSQSIQVTDVP